MVMTDEPVRDEMVEEKTKTDRGCEALVWLTEDGKEARPVNCGNPSKVETTLGFRCGDHPYIPTDKGLRR